MKRPRLFMILDVNGDFSFERKNKMDKQNEIVRQWKKILREISSVNQGKDERERWNLLYNF